jgi:uncharacterized protein (TIGR02453 family)
MQAATFDFLRKLEKHNDREWFQANKHLYEAARADVAGFVDQLIGAMLPFAPGLAHVDPNKALFRIYRDVRFSANKAPYKTNFGANLPVGISSYYLHIQPGRSFVAGGLYMPDKDQLKAVRREIDLDGESFRDVLQAPAFRRHFKGFSTEDSLKRIPAGYPIDHPMADLLRLKHYVVVRDVRDEEVLAADAPRQLARMYKAMKPLHDLLNDVLGG